MPKPHATLAALATASLLAAQSTVTIPENMAGVEGNSNTTIPWERVGIQTRVLYQHDASNFTNQGVAYPITISSIEWRAQQGVTTGPEFFPSVVIDMSTGATSWQTQSAQYASNHGADRAQVYNGSVTTVPGAGTAPNNFHASATLSTPFSYDPLNGSDLVIEVLTDALYATGTGTKGDLTTTGNCSRLWDLDLATSGFSANVQPGASSALRLTYTPAPGLWAGFSADKRNGTPPLTVNFMDRSVTDDPGGILTWSWDLDGDGTADSTLQNPTFVYNTPGAYKVSLTVTDNVHGSSTYAISNYIIVGDVDADFDARQLGNLTFLFNDISTGFPDSWAWDFDGNGTIDSTLQNPTWTYGTQGPHTVALTASNSVGGFTDTETKIDYIDSKLCTLYNNTARLSGFTGNFFELTVKHQDGVVISALDVTCQATNPALISVWVTSDTYFNKDTNPSVWRRVATGNIPFPLGGGGIDNVDISDFYLPPGRYGVAVYSSAGLTYTSGSTMAFDTYALGFWGGRSRSALFGGTLYNPRVWNGCMYVEQLGTPGYGFYGEGCPGAAGVASLAPTGVPRLGNAFSVTVGNTPANTAMAMAIGFSNTNAAFAPLPFDMGAIGLTNCSLYTSIFVTTPLLANGAGQATWSLPIPNNPALLQAKFFNQALVVDTSAPGLAVMSDAWGGLIGL